jgi:hypothetical protein
MADRRFVRVLAAVLTDGLEAVEARSAKRLMPARQRRGDPQHPGPAPRAAPAAQHHVTAEDLALSHPPIADCARYDSCEAFVQRHEMIAAMRGSGLKGMAGAFDEAVTTGVQRKRTDHGDPDRPAARRSRTPPCASIRYRMTAAKLPVVKDLDAFVFEGTPINEGWCARSTPARSCPHSATSCWSAAPAPARPIWPSPSPPASCAPAPAAATSTPSIW